MNETQLLPTDAAIDTLILEHGVMDQAWPTQRQLHAFARAVLAMRRVPLNSDQRRALLDSVDHFNFPEDLIQATEEKHGIKQGGQHGIE